MSVIMRQVSVSSPIEKVLDLLTDLARISEFTEVLGTAGAPSGKMAIGTTWKNRGVTMGLPTSDTTTVTDLTETRIAWTTRSMLLGFVPTQMNWAYNLDSLVKTRFEEVPAI